MSEKNQDNQPIDPVIRAALRARQVAASGSCVDAETLAAWSEGGLDQAHVAAVDAHLADCLRCQAVLAAFAESSESAVPAQAVPAGVVVPFAKPSRLRWLAPAAAGLAAAALLFWMIQPAPDTAPSLATQLAEAPASRPTATPPAIVAAPEQPAPATSTSKQAADAARRQEGGAPPAKPSPLPMPGAMLPANPAYPPNPANPANQNVTLGAAPPQTAQTKPAPAAVVPPPPPPPPPAVAAPPPKPAIAVDTMARADRNTLKFEPNAKKFPIEFGPPTTAGAGRGGAGGGGGGARAGGVAALRTSPAVPTTIRWRILESGRVERTINAGETWTAVALEAAVFISAGSAPAPAVCWLVGREGAVFRSIDGATFARIDFPHDLDLESVTAQSADRATVSTRDGRSFTTTDGGHTWRSN